MGQVVSLHAERWVEGVFSSGSLRVDVSTKGNVRFALMVGEHGEEEIYEDVSMADMARMTEALAVAYRKEKDDG